MTSSRSVSFDSLDDELSHLRPRTLQEEVSDIRQSLDAISSRLRTQQIAVSRDFEDRIRTVYDSVINDINAVRKHVNNIGESVAAPSKYKTWAPVAPFRKSILRNAYELQKPTPKLKGSKSVDFVDAKAIEKDGSTGLSGNKGRLVSSTSSIDKRYGSRSRLPGYGSCFYGDNKTIPYRSQKTSHNSQRNVRHSWGPSSYGSRSTLDDDDGDVTTEVDLEKGCLCGEVTDDWRAKVAPHMWQGWMMPGLDIDDVSKLKERLAHFEELREDAVNGHNEHRRCHGCPDLRLSHDLSRDAHMWAESIAAQGYAQYSEATDRGENILVVDIEGELSGRQVVDTWYREHALYNRTRPGWQRGTSNFTQLVWRESACLGVGVAKFPRHDTYVIVAQYQPPGNVNTPAQFAANIPPRIRRYEVAPEISVPKTLSDVNVNRVNIPPLIRRDEVAPEISMPNTLSDVNRVNVPPLIRRRNVAPELPTIKTLSDENCITVPPLIRLDDVASEFSTSKTLSDVNRVDAAPLIGSRDETVLQHPTPNMLSDVTSKTSPFISACETGPGRLPVASGITLGVTCKGTPNVIPDAPMTDSRRSNVTPDVTCKDNKVPTHNSVEAFVLVETNPIYTSSTILEDKKHRSMANSLAPTCSTVTEKTQPIKTSGGGDNDCNTEKQDPIHLAQYRITQKHATFTPESTNSGTNTPDNGKLDGHDSQTRHEQMSVKGYNPKTNIIDKNKQELTARHDKDLNRIGESELKNLSANVCNAQADVVKGIRTDELYDTSDPVTKPYDVKVKDIRHHAKLGKMKQHVRMDESDVEWPASTDFRV